MEFKMLSKKELIRYMPSFRKLYSKCFSGEITDDEIYWRYINNPLKDILVNVAIENGEIVANYAVSPIKVNYKGNIINAGLSLNTMTDPDYRGKGLFVKLAEELYDHMKACGYKLVVGFPHYTSNRGFQEKLGWKNIYEIPMMEYRLAEDIIEEEANVIEVNQIRCFEDITKEKNINIVKDDKYIMWRYYENPSVKYHAIEDGGGFIIYKIHQNKINIVENKFVSRENMMSLVTKLIRHAKYIKKDTVTSWATINSVEHLVLQKLGFKNNFPIIYFGGVSLNEEVEDDIYDYRDWIIKLGDDNIF
ncbi:GNAT family N-acetyltransferase [Clostridium paraputrificum]|uniref:GNAT family N-acetyltransferase n=1 Tax=Clostridium paraputrificum TaxID=29363 RepID=UPI00325AE2AA